MFLFVIKLQYCISFYSKVYIVFFLTVLNVATAIISKNIDTPTIIFVRMTNVLEMI
jgi:hypothetical protein